MRTEREVHHIAPHRQRGNDETHPVGERREEDLLSIFGIGGEQCLLKEKWAKSE